MSGLDFNDPQVRAILGIGSLSDRQSILQQQLARSQALRDAPLQQHSTGWGAALGGLGHVVDTVNGSLRENDVRKRQQGLQDERQRAVNAYAGMLGGLDTSAFEGQAEPTAEQTKSFSDALSRRRQVAQLGISTGDSALTRLGQSAMDEADRAEKAPQTRLQRALEAQKLAKEKQETAAKGQAENEANDPNSQRSVLARAMAEKMGAKLAPTATAAQVERALPVLEKSYAADSAASARRDAAAAAAAARRDAAADRAARFQDPSKALIELSNALDPNKPRGGLLADNQKRINAAGRLEKLASDALGNPENLDSRQMEELAIGLQSMLANSGHGSDREVSALVPKSAMGNAQKMVEWLTNAPRGTGQVEFVKRMLGTIRREKDTAQSQLYEALKAELPARAGLKASHPNEYAAVVRARGLDPETGEPLGAAPQAAAPGAHPQDAEAVKWAKSHPDDSRAAKILQLAGSQ